MRSDKSLPEEIRANTHWQKDPLTGATKPALDRLTYYHGPDYHRHSYSGYERNKLFMNRGGREFLDLSAISGADTEADSRTWCALDYDRDGRTDIVVVNANTPLLNLFRNRIGEAGGRPGRFVAVRLIGGNHTAASSALSNRDGIGAVVSVTAGGRTMMRVRRCGEGFAAHNSSEMLIGIGEAADVSEVRVSWPSGRVSEVRSIPAGTGLVFTESDGTVVQERYVGAQP